MSDEQQEVTVDAPEPEAPADTRSGLDRAFDDMEHLAALRDGDDEPAESPPPNPQVQTADEMLRNHGPGIDFGRYIEWWAGREPEAAQAYATAHPDALRGAMDATAQAQAERAGAERAAQVEAREEAGYDVYADVLERYEAAEEDFDNYDEAAAWHLAEEVARDAPEHLTDFLAAWAENDPEGAEGYRAAKMASVVQQEHALDFLRAKAMEQQAREQAALAAQFEAQQRQAAVGSVVDEAKAVVRLEPDMKELVGPFLEVWETLAQQVPNATADPISASILTRTAYEAARAEKDADDTARLLEPLDAMIWRQDFADDQTGTLPAYNAEEQRKRIASEFLRYGTPGQISAARARELAGLPPDRHFERGLAGLDERLAQSEETTKGLDKLGEAVERARAENQRRKNPWKAPRNR
jgi:hypothetical protein